MTLPSNVKNSWISKATLVIFNFPTEGYNGGFSHFLPVFCFSGINQSALWLNCLSIALSLQTNAAINKNLFHPNHRSSVGQRVFSWSFLLTVQQKLTPDSLSNTILVEESLLNFSLNSLTLRYGIKNLLF